MGIYSDPGGERKWGGGEETDGRHLHRRETSHCCREIHPLALRFHCFSILVSLFTSLSPIERIDRTNDIVK